jgi:hypothetical protein
MITAEAVPSSFQLSANSMPIVGITMREVLDVLSDLESQAADLATIPLCGYAHGASLEICSVSIAPNPYRQGIAAVFHPRAPGDQNATLTAKDLRKRCVAMGREGQLNAQVLLEVGGGAPRRITRFSPYHTTEGCVAVVGTVA